MKCNDMYFVIEKTESCLNLTLFESWNSLARRPITLVLMMINLCSYSTNDLVFIQFQIFNKMQKTKQNIVGPKAHHSSFDDDQLM